MSNNRKKLGIFLIILGLIIIFLIIYFSFWRKSPLVLTPVVTPTPTTTASLPVSLTGTTTPSNKPQGHTTYNLAQESPHQTNATDLSKIAMAFAERFGSFSNQSGYSNISDLQISMTDSMRTWSNTYIQQLTNQYQNNGKFYGITTHSLLTTVTSFNEAVGRAEIVVTTQRTELGKAPYNQTLDVKFLKVGDNWLVDNAHWGK